MENHRTKYTKWAIFAASHVSVLDGIWKTVLASTIQVTSRIHIKTVYC